MGCLESIGSDLDLRQAATGEDESSGSSLCDVLDEDTAQSSLTDARDENDLALDLPRKILEQIVGRSVGVVFANHFVLRLVG